MKNENEERKKEKKFRNLDRFKIISNENDVFHDCESISSKKVMTDGW